MARLARIKLTKNEEEKMKNELGFILNYIEQLEQVKTDDVKLLYQTTGVVNLMREDKYHKNFEMDERLNQKLIGQAPDSQNRFIKVKSVLKKS